MKLHHPSGRIRLSCSALYRSMAASVVATTLIQTPPVLAQTSALEEVIVTARKRDESLQDTPVAITAFSGSRLQETGITNLTDFNRIVPNVDVQAGNGNAGVANIYIRGVGQRNTEPNLDSGVGIYLDGVYVGRADGALLDVNDLQSVQVLRGPQGTLFGKNTTGGALVFTTNRPGPELEGSLLLRGGNYQRRDIEGVINLPLVDDTLYTRLSVVSKDRDGYLKNLVDNKYYNDEDRLSAVWQLRWLPSDDLTVDLNANYGRTQQKPQLQKCVVSPDPDHQGWAWHARALESYISKTPGMQQGVYDLCRQSEVLGTYEAMSDLGGSYHARNKGLSLTLDWAFTDHMNLKSISGWRWTRAGQDDDLDHLPIQFLHRTNNSHPFARDRITDQYSQELQLTGEAFDGALTYATGVYGFVEKTKNSRTANIVGPFVNGPTVLIYTATATGLEVDNRAWSGFAQADWNFAPSWRLTAGARYTWEKRQLEQTFYDQDLSTLSLSGAHVAQFIPTAKGMWAYFGLPSGITAWDDFNYNHGFVETGHHRRSVKATAWTPMVSLQYFLPEGRWINGGSAYLTYSEGFRSGGLTEWSTGPVRFKPEEVDNYELGLKVDAFNNRVRLNTALFHMEYNNRQLTTVSFDLEAGIPAQNTINAKESTISGIEIESMIIPVDNLELTLNATWNRGRIKKYEDIQISPRFMPGEYANSHRGPRPGGYNCGRQKMLIHDVFECTIDRSHENLPRLAKRIFFASAQYHIQTPMGIFTPRIQGSWKFDQENCFDYSSCQSGLWFTKKQFDLSARLTWSSLDEQWMAALYGSNLTKEEYVIGGTPLVDNVGYGGVAFNPPRMYGAEIQYRW